jgi:hypothetical protein
LGQPVGKPQLDKRLPRYAHPVGFPIKGIHHPSREIDVDSFRISTNPPSFAQVEFTHDLPARIEPAIKSLGFHKALPQA